MLIIITYHSWTDMVLIPYQMKHLIILSLLFGIVLCSCNYNTTLKITDVQVNPENRYNEVAARYLGKKISLEVYDKSAKLTIEGQQPKVLKLYNTEYIGSGCSFTIKKSVGRISKLEYSLYEWQTTSVPFQTKIDLIAK